MTNGKESNNALVCVFEGHKVRILDQDGAPWFVLADVCKVLEIANVGNAAARLEPDERDDIRLTDAIGRSQSTVIINEAGMYRLVLRSDKPEAKRFQKWVVTEVLPTIRKTGSYGADINAQIAQAISTMTAAQIAVVKGLALKAEDLEASLARETERRVETQNSLVKLEVKLCSAEAEAIGKQELIDLLEPDAAAYREFMDQEDGTIGLQDAGRIITGKPNTFIKSLINKEYLFRRETGSLQPYAKYVNKFFKVKIVSRSNDPTKLASQTVLTRRGFDHFVKMQLAGDMGLITTEEDDDIRLH